MSFHSGAHYTHVCMAIISLETFWFDVVFIKAREFATLLNDYETVKREHTLISMTPHTTNKTVLQTNKQTILLKYCFSRIKHSLSHVVIVLRISRTGNIVWIVFTSLIINDWMFRRRKHTAKKWSLKRLQEIFRLKHIARSNVLVYQANIPSNMRYRSSK